MASIAVFQDQENTVHEQGKSNLGITRVAPKPFHNESVHEATPRKAFGDVSNIQTQRPNSSVKAVLQSDRKVPTTVSKNPKSAFRKPLGTSKKSGKKLIKILEDDSIAKPDAKQEIKSKRSEASFMQDLTQKENFFPFKDEDFHFEMPEYLKDLSSGCISDHIWLPPHTECSKKEYNNEFDLDVSKLEVEDLPIHSDLYDSYFDDMIRENANNSTNPTLLITHSDNFIALGEIENDLSDIDIFCSFGEDFADIVQKFDAMELCCNVDADDNNENLSTSMTVLHNANKTESESK